MVEDHTINAKDYETGHKNRNIQLNPRVVSFVDDSGFVVSV